VPAGVDALSVRLVLAGGGTALFAGVEDPSYIINRNGSVTFDLIQVRSFVMFSNPKLTLRQTDLTALPYTQFREVHEYDLTTCKMTKITGYGFGQLLPETILT
jgi:hypothetical protein